jgi:hypothetical protein
MQGNKISLHRSADQGSTYGPAIASVIGLEIGERTAAIVDATEYGLEDDYERADYGLKSGGEWNVTIRYKEGQTDVEAIIDALDNSTKEYIQAQFPAPISQSLSIRCLVTKVGIAVPKEGQVDRMLTLKVDGRPTEAALA